MGRAGYCYREVVPFTVMVMAECTNVGLSTIFKAATNEGLSYLVFMVYSYVISTLFLLSIAFLFHRFTAQLATYKGIEYTSPTLCSDMNNLTPASTFVLAIIFSLGAPRLNLLRATQILKDFGNIIPLQMGFPHPIHDTTLKCKIFTFSPRGQSRPRTTDPEDSEALVHVSSEWGVAQGLGSPSRRRITKTQACLLAPRAKTKVEDDE
ncbi:hypothetical protein LguiB_008817 [Lonicera macranthoides]